MMVKKYKAVIEKIESVIEGVYTVTFSSNGIKFRYSPGQFLHIAIDTEYDGIGQWPESRCFSIQTSPEEEFIKITYAVKGNFTKQMEKVLKEGGEVWLKMPYGELFELAHDKSNTVFISGGTGITPYLSLFTDSSFTDYQNPVLYAGYRNKDFNIYSKELDKASSINSEFIINNVYENESGMLDVEKIYKENGNRPSYFISGPPVMIKLFKQKLLSFGVQEKNVYTDEWE
ncbi:MAG: FAD-dependent oxidoreductase [Atribacterota bacterium]|nr:FAD-dependent oxidoreductase [Atribacterota bacterium]